MKINKILISQPKPTSDKSPYYDIEQKYGVNLVFRPFFKVQGLTSKEFRQLKVSLADHTAVIFTAKVAIDHFFRLAEETRFTVPETMKYFCTTESIALYLQKYIVYRKRKIFFGKSGKLDDLIPFMLKHASDKYLYVVSEASKKTDDSLLDKNHINYSRTVMYRSISNDFQEGEDFDYDMIVFFSPSGIKALQKNFPDFVQGDIKIGCFGASTAKAITDAGFRLDLEAPTVNAPSMTAALDQFLKAESKKK